MTMQTETKTNGHTTRARPELVMLDIEQVEAHPNNPRKTFNEIDELAASITEHGLLEPIMVRPTSKGGRYQLVFGERRWRASKKAKQPTILAIVRTLDDRQCEEIMIVENTKRSDLHPLEEAEGYERMHKVRGLTVDELAAKVGKSVAQIYARMKLCALCKEARKAFYAGTIDASKALLLARIPHEDLQREALKAITAEREVYIDDGNDPISDGIDPIKLVPSYRDAVHIIQSRFMLRLVEAPFDRGDVTLVSKAGACTTCPKRTGNQKELFTDVASADVCIDPACYRTKVDAEWERRKVKAVETKQEILEGKDAKKLFVDGGALTYSTGFVDVDAERYDGHTNKKTTLRKKLGGKLPQTVLARDREGNIHELVKEHAARSSSEHTSSKPSTAEKKRRDLERTRMAKQEAKCRLEAKQNELAILALVERAESKQPAAELWRALAVFVLGNASSEILQRRELITKGSHLYHDVKKLSAITAKLSEKTLRGLVVECIASETASTSVRTEFDMLCEFYKVDPKKFIAEAKAAVGTGA